MGEYSKLEPVQAKATPELAIHINPPPVTVPGQPSFFHPGETITGSISRQQHIVTPRGTLTIALIGRSATIYTKRRRSGNNTTTRHYYSKFVLFEITHQVFDGPMHIPAGAAQPQTWPFSVTIPTHPSASTSNILTKRPERSFLPLDAQALPNTALPPSFQFHSGYSHDEVDAWVEYYLEATLAEQHEGTSFFTGGPKSPKIKHARIPIPLSQAPTPPLVDYRILRHKIPGQLIISQRLLPGRGAGEGSKLSTREHLSRFFHTSSVPRYAFSVELEFPTVLQFGNSIPLGIRVVPDAKLTSENIADVEQTVRLVKVELRITAKVATKIDYDSSWNTEGYGKDVKVYLKVDFTEPGERQAVGGEIIVPASPNTNNSGQTGTGKGNEVPVGVSRRDEEEGESSSSPPTYSGPSNNGGITQGESAAVGSGSKADATSGSGQSTNPSHQIHLVQPGQAQAPFLNLGEKMKLQLGRISISRAGGGSHERWGGVELAPDFLSYNIAVDHLLKWEVTLDVVGEKTKVSAEHRIGLVPGWN